MNIDDIEQCMNQSLAGQITFPQVVMKLAEAGAERYLVDLVSFQKSTYGQEGDYHTASFTFQDVPNIPKIFNAAAVKNTISEIQQQKINYQTFLRCIMSAGCCHYEVYINGRKAIYFGRDGNSHVENFPPSK